MKIRVTLSNILEYGLDVVTGRSRADLLATAESYNNNGAEYYIHIPDVAGGDNDAPTERNAFEHFSSDLPEPEGHTHKQESLNLAEQEYIKDPCSYRPNVHIDGSYTWVCIKHGAISKHSVDGESHEPCEVVDPFDA